MTRLDIQITPYTPSLRTGLWDLLLSVTSKTHNNVSEKQIGLAEKLLRSATSPNTSITVALYQDQIVAYAEEHPLTGHRRVHLHRMATHRNFRNRMIFTQLLEAVISDTSTHMEADINQERDHYKTMQRFGFVPDNRPSREPGMIAIVRPARTNIARFFIGK